MERASQGKDDPLAGSSWSRPETVAGFTQSAPNPVLMQAAEAERVSRGAARAVDLGCGAGRNAVPLARAGWRVVGIDLSRPMLEALASRVRDEGLGGRVVPALAPMHALPAATASADLVIAHGIWNLARSAAEFRRAVAEAARVAAPGAALFVFTFSRNTFPPDTQPVAGEEFVFTEFSGQPQVFLTEAQLGSELAAAGFAADAGIPFRELNRRAPGAWSAGGPPVIHEGLFRRVGGGA